ncbi:hypothetical protein AB6A40_003863 [Gnathostoma spinigerum]|uniref:Cytochrome P450 n=1 Tax=Gnathostoma spinigerum TaxID=75299 RepID=A0ABD6EG96_9BILA
MSIVALSAVLISTVVIICSVLYSRYLAKCSITGRGFPLVKEGGELLYGHLKTTNCQSTPWIFAEYRKRYGKTFAFMQGAFPTVVTSDINLIEEICLKKFSYFHSRMADPTSGNPDQSCNVHMFAARGQRWKRIRSLTSPALSNKNLKLLYPTIEDSVNRWMNELSRDVLKNPDQEIHRRFQNLTFDVIARCCLGRSESCQHNDANLELILKKFSGTKMWRKLTFNSLLWSLPQLKRIFALGTLIWDSTCSLLGLPADPMGTFSSNIEQIVEKREKFDVRHDFLQFMKNVEDNEWSEWKSSNDVRIEMATTRIVKKLIPEELISTARFMSTAGFDTTANTLTYITFLLSCHPEIQEKLRAEVSSPTEISFEAVQSMQYLHWTLAETLRLFPHASLLQSRRCVQDSVIGNYEFKRGVNIMFDTWSLHHDPETWGTDAEIFRPERTIVGWISFAILSWDGIRHHILKLI